MLSLTDEKVYFKNHFQRKQKNVKQNSHSALFYGKKQKPVPAPASLIKSIFYEKTLLPECPV